MINPLEIKIRYECYDNLFKFVKYILNYNLLEEKPHKELCDFIQYTDSDLLDLEPRDHFKTTCITIGFSIWAIIRNPNIRILINHKTLKKAKEILREIKEQFEKNEKLKYFYGNYVGDKWRDDEIIISKRSNECIMKEPTIAIGAIDHSIASSHYDMIINDDLAGLEDMISEAARKSTLQYFKSLRFLRDKKNFIKMITIGTRWHLFDLYNHIIDKTDTKIRIKKSIDENGNVYFPNRYKLEDLKKIEEEDPVLFQSQMQNNPIAFDEQLYTLDKLKFYDNDSVKIDYIIAYCDPAFGKKEKGEPCYFSFIIANIINENIYIVEWISNKNNPEDNENLIIEKIIQYKMNRFAIESNAQQSEFIRNVEKAITKHNESKFQDQKIILGIESINHTTNKDRRIQGMHGTVIKYVYFRKDWQDIYSESMKQLTLYPYHKFKDAPDALEGVIEMYKGKFNYDFNEKDVLIINKKNDK